MNPAIGRGMPAPAHPFDNTPRKQAGNTTGAAGFQEALGHEDNSREQQPEAEKSKEPGSHLLRWSLPQKLNAHGKLQEVGVEEETAQESQDWLRQEIADATIAPAGEPERSDLATPGTPATRAETPPHPRTPDLVVGDALDPQSSSAKGVSLPQGNAAPAPQPLHTAQAAFQAGPPTPALQSSTSVPPEHPIPQRTTPRSAENVAGERPTLAGTDAKSAQPVPTAKAETLQRIGHDGLLRDNLQQQQSNSQQQAEIRVVSIQRAPAPSPSSEQPLASTRMATGETGSLNLPQQGEAGRMVQTLKIQLHPAELGMVTARLRIVADQLTVDLQVENAEARHRLGSDSDSIVKALRSLGYEIDRVTVQHASPGGQGNTATGGNSRDSGFQSLNDGQGEGNRPQERGNERSGREQSRSSSRPGQESSDPVQNGLYI